MAVATYGLDYGSGGVALKAAGLVAADTAETGVYVGRGWIAVRIAWTAAEVASTDELYNVTFQANTAAATSTWIDLQVGVAFGDSVALGGAVDTAATGEMWVGVFNPYDHQIRINTFVAGTIATGFNFAADAYPLTHLR